MRTLCALGASSVVAAASITGCSSGSHQESPTPAPPPAGWPPVLNDFTMVWTAEPGIDVTAWPAVAVRAYTESYLLATIMGGDRYLYPGFKQAVDPNQGRDHPTGMRFRWPATDHPPRDPWVGTEQAHILSVNKSNHDVTVVVCEYLFGTAEATSYGKYRNHISAPAPMAGIYPMRLVMTAPDHAGPQQPPQQGPARAPSVDVFNGWKITSHQGGYFAEFYATQTEWPNSARDNDACNAKAPPHRDLLREGEYPREYFPTRPASPGWPAAKTNH